MYYIKEEILNIYDLLVFRLKCFILNNGKDNLGKFDEKVHKGIFIGYSISSKYFTIFNKRTLIVEESALINFDESNPKLL